MISIVPGYISRSVAGSYDNEGIAIFCMLLTYYLWIKAVKTGAILWSTMSALAYFYMVSSWGGYVFLINLIPLHVLALMLTGRFSHRIYVAFSILYCVGTILSMQISFVGFQPVQSSEHMLVSCRFKRNRYIPQTHSVFWIFRDETIFDRKSMKHNWFYFFKNTDNKYTWFEIVTVFLSKWLSV